MAYYLSKENIAVSEMLCDVAAAKGMSKEEKQAVRQPAAFFYKTMEQVKGKEYAIISV